MKFNQKTFHEVSVVVTTRLLASNNCYGSYIILYINVSNCKAVKRPPLSDQTYNLIVFVQVYLLSLYLSINQYIIHNLICLRSN